MEHKKILGIPLSLIVLFLLIYFVYQDVKKVTDIKQDTESSGNDYVIEQISESTTTMILPPDTERLLINVKGIDENTRKVIIQSLTQAQDALKTNPDSIELWLNLATVRKIAEDYEGAKDIWEYVTKRAPSDHVAYLNLANLHGYYFRDSVTASGYYDKVIGLKPSIAQPYLAAAEFHLKIRNDKKRAIAVIEEGLKNIPHNAELAGMLETLKE